MDDKDGSVCNEGPWPVLNTIKRELQIMTTTKTPTTKTTTIHLPFGFWSQRRVSEASFLLTNKFIQVTSFVLNIIFFFNTFDFN